jgi:hypothetical protein
MDADSAMGVRLLAGADGAHYVSWVERHGKRSRLVFSKLGQGDSLSWGAPQIIAQGDDWFVNWADFPVLAALPGGALAATWLQSAGREGTWDYGARICFSSDAGATWSESRVLHEDSSGPEYGFVSMAPLGPDAFGVVWLDSRNMTGGDHGSGGHGSGSMALYFRRFNAAGEPGPELLLDDSTCECCSTSALVDGSGALQVAYRNRTADETRDMNLVTLGGELGFERRKTVEDGWVIAGCPVNGPSLASHKQSLAMAWFTAAGAKAAVQVAVSKDGGASFGSLEQLDLGAPMGRVQSCYDNSGQLYVAWLEAAPADSEGEARWMLWRAGLDEQAQILTGASGARTSGFASLVAAPDGGCLFAWTTVAGDGDQTGVASISIQ